MVDLRDLGEEHLHSRARRLPAPVRADPVRLEGRRRPLLVRCARPGRRVAFRQAGEERPAPDDEDGRSEEHTSELQSLMRTSSAVFCLKKKKEITYDNIS